MKKLLTILCLVLLVSCSNEVNEVPSHRLIENGGMTYEIGSNNPFTGVSVNYKNGQIKERKTFKDGVQEGLWEKYRYYDNGQLWETENYKDGKRDGLWEWYRENGQLFSRENFKDGVPEGLPESFDQEGNLIRTRFF